jgi:hypothetical protein
MKRSLPFSILLVICFACSKPIPELNDVDLSVWKNDVKGCKGDRKQFYKPLSEQKDKLKGLSEIDLVKLLGKPDRNDLSERHEKYYFYFIEPAVECGKDSSTMILEVRFNATGVSKEVTILDID